MQNIVQTMHLTMSIAQRPTPTSLPLDALQHMQSSLSALLSEQARKATPSHKPPALTNATSIADSESPSASRHPPAPLWSHQAGKVVVSELASL